MNKDVLNKLCSAKNVTIAELERELGMSNGSLRKDGDVKSERLLAIAKYFNVSMEFLMGIDEISSAPVPKFEPEQMKLISLWSQLTGAEKKIILETMTAFVAHHNQ